MAKVTSVSQEHTGLTIRGFAQRATVQELTLMNCCIACTLQPSKARAMGSMDLRSMSSI
jgi:hypothetical protein